MGQKQIHSFGQKNNFQQIDMGEKKSILRPKHNYTITQFLHQHLFFQFFQNMTFKSYGVTFPIISHVDPAILNKLAFGNTMSNYLDVLSNRLKMVRAQDRRPYRFDFKEFITGHHVYKDVWTPSHLGEELCCESEPNNHRDKHAVKVVKNTETVGHVPKDISPVYDVHFSERCDCDWQKEMDSK